MLASAPNMRPKWGRLATSAQSAASPYRSPAMSKISKKQKETKKPAQTTFKEKRAAKKLKQETRPLLSPIAPR